MIKKIASGGTAFILLSIIMVGIVGASPSAQAQSAVASDKLAKFAALMQYIRSEPTPSDVNPALISLFDSLDNALSGIYITGFITPFTGETPEQVNARLQSIPAEDRFIAVMVESYHLADNDTLLDLIHDLLARYYVETFIVGYDLSGAASFMEQDAIATLADSFDPADYAISAPTETTTPMSTLTATATPTQVVGPAPNLRHIDQKRYMLKLINAERAKAGLGSVVLGDNIAAQLHAESALENCFSSHWGIDGLKPYMRYSLAGGYQSNGENALGRNYCIRVGDGFHPNGSIEQEVRDAMGIWMESSGHRRNILDKWHKKVNIGLAWDRYNVSFYQHFEGDYVDYEQLPTIKDKVLYISGTTKNGVQFTGDRDLSVQLYYDPPPGPLTRGQLSKTYCYDNGRPVTAFRRPAPAGSRYTEHTFTTSYQRCTDPYDFPADTPAPEPSPLPDIQLPNPPPITLTLPWTTALEWRTGREEFSVRANLRNLLSEHGNGVYTFIIWAKSGSENVVISQYSIFHGVTPPDTYSIESVSTQGTPTATPTTTPTPMSTPTTPPATPTIAQLVKNVEGSVVHIVALTGSGSGFIIDADGRVVTNQHVVGGNRRVTVRMHDGTEYTASVLGVDPVADLAVVDIVPEITLTYVHLGDSSQVQVGEEVIAIGYPLGFQLGQSQTVTDGIISSKRVYDGVEHLQTNADINPGNSGGPLFNRAGHVIGVNTSRVETTSDGRPVSGISFAVSIDELKSRLETLKGSGSPQPVPTPTPVPTPATPVPTPSAAPTPLPIPAGWNKYNNGVYGFSVATPPGWTVNENTEELDFAYFSAPDNKASVAIQAYDLPTSYSLQALAEWNRDWWTDLARDESWNVFEITSFSRKQESGKEFYELAYRWQSTTEFCVSRDIDRIYISSWYPGKPHGYSVNTGVCEDSLSRHSANTRAIQDSFIEWMPYWNFTHAFGLNVAPGWILDKSTEVDDYAEFWAPDNQGAFEVFVYEVAPSSTLEDFTNWRIEILNALGSSWEVYEPKGTTGIGGALGARKEYLIAYVSQPESQYCVSDNVDLLALSSFFPGHPYGFLVTTGVCQHSSDLYDDERWEMIEGFRY